MSTTTTETSEKPQEGTAPVRASQSTPDGDLTSPDLSGELDEGDESEAGSDQAGGQGEGGPNREAAKYRTRLREAEAQRDALAGRLEVMQRAEAERLAVTADGPRLRNPADLWLGGAELGQMLGDDGQLDPVKVAAVIAGLTTDRPYLRAGRFGGGVDQGVRGTQPRPEKRMGAIFSQDAS